MSSPRSYKVEIISARLAACDHAAATIEAHIIFRGECKSSRRILAQTSSDIEINFSADLLMSHSQPPDDSDDWHAVIYITSQSADSGANGNSYRQLMARAFLDLRLAQVHNGNYLSVEIFHCMELTDGLESGSAGLLFLKLCCEGSDITAEASAQLSERIQTTQNRINNEMHQTFQAMRILWAKARKNFPFIENRPLIKLIAEDECGQNRVCCDYICPIFPPRDSQLANGPRFAARFVSLIPFNRVSSLSGGRREQWLPAQAMLLRRAGDVEDHANLLCSLLLGWGMNAYVCSGYIRSSFQRATSTSSGSGGGSGSGSGGHQLGAGETAVPHYWVVTSDAMSSMLFWEPLSGQQFEIPLGKYKVDLDASTRRHHPFLSISVLYRHDSYLLNVQQNALLQHNSNSYQGPDTTSFSTSASSSSSSLFAASFEVSDRKCWVELLPSTAAYAVRLAGADADTNIRRYTGHPATYTSLTANTSYLSSDGNSDTFLAGDVIEMELKIEKEIEAMIVAWRDEEGLTTQFDGQLGIIMQPALYAYEQDRVMCSAAIALAVSAVDSDFQESIRNYVGKGRGQCFKAFPTCFCSRSSTSDIRNTLAQAAAARDVIFTPQKSTTRFSVRVKVFSYPAGIYALWVMLAVRFDAKSAE